MKKSIIALLLVLAMAACMACGCAKTQTGSADVQSGQTAASESAAAEQSTEEAAEPAVSTEEAAEPADDMQQDEQSGADTAEVAVSYRLTDEPATLGLWYPSASAFQSSIDYTQHERFKQTEELTGVHIELQLVTNETASEKLNLLVASNEYPDMVQNPNQVTGGLPSAIENEFLIPLNDYYDEYMPHYKAIRESDEAYSKDSQLEDGTLPMAYTFYKEGYGINMGPVIRQDWLDQLGLEAPRTYDEYHDVLTAFKDRLGADAALWIPYNGTLSGYLIAGFGTTNGVLDRDGTIEYGPITEQFRDYLRLLNQWYSEGLIFDEFATYTQNAQYPPDELVTWNRCGIWYSTAAMLPDFEAKSSDGTMVLAPITDAVKEVGDKNHFCHNYSLVLGGGTGVTTNCSDPALAAAWLDFQYTDAGYMLNNYGEEGLTYVLDENGKPQFTDLITDNPDGLPMPIAIEKYACMNGPFVVDYDRMNGGYTETQKSCTPTWSSVSDNAWMVANVPLSTEESAETSSIQADINTYSVAQIARFIMGELNLDTDWDEYVQTSQELGVQKLVDIYSDAAARYAAR